MRCSKIKITIATVVLALASVISARADTVSFVNVVALQNAGFTRVDLSSTPNVILFGPQVSFLVDIVGATPSAGIHTLRLTFNEGGGVRTENLRVPLFDGLPPDYSQQFSFNSQNPSFLGTPVLLTIDLLNDSSGAILQTGTYSFTVASPVPEPTTVSLLVLGLLGLAAKKRRR